MDTQITISSIALAVLFGAYAWTSTVIFGVALARLLPKWSNAGLVSRLTRPLWECSLLILVLGYVGIAGIFNDQLLDLAGDVLPTLLIGLAALVVRLITLLYVSYGTKHTPGPTPANALLATASFVVLACVAAVGIYLLTGQAFWATASGWVFMLMMLALFKASGLAFVYWHAKETADHRLQWSTRIAIGAFALLATIAAQIIVREDTPHLLSVPFGMLAIIIACVLLWQGALLTTRRADHGVWWYLSLIIIVLPALLALANSPWLAYGHYKWEHLYEASGYVVVIYASLFSILIAVALAAMARRLSSRKT